jgi:hypothetical protein
MKVFAISSLVAVAAAAADPQITPRAELAPRQNSDPAFLGWVSASTCKHLPCSLTRCDEIAVASLFLLDDVQYRTILTMVQLPILRFPGDPVAQRFPRAMLLW